ncbi:hypothetical protein K438DRAFT_1777103 [Mycena galopus ATCC 62051]|nr:hypothetical protein K438DRAFT_1777103 [Mycena galopus ATCC 62051]
MPTKLLDPGLSRIEHCDAMISDPVKQCDTLLDAVLLSLPVYQEKDREVYSVYRISTQKWAELVTRQNGSTIIDGNAPWWSLFGLQNTDVHVQRQSLWILEISVMRMRGVTNKDDTAGGGV